MIKKVVIPAAGLGTRLLSATKEQPKEMLPVFAKDSNGALCLKPLVQLIFEQLYDFGIRNFCFIVGRGKRAIEDHFTPDYQFIKSLDDKGKNSQASQLESFYKIVDASTIVWVNQPEPKGFGHAVLQAKSFIGDEPFLVHAGDTYIVSEGNDHLNRLIKEHQSKSTDVSLLLQEVHDPRQYGVAEVIREGSKLIVKRVVEKPEQPKTNLAIMPIYVFNPVIFRALEAIGPGKGGEIQLTDGIQKLIDWRLEVRAIKLRERELRLDIGTPETYWEAQRLSYEYFKEQARV
ncbi:MAG: UTP--glucose-1-phosphate uridylyltransferase [archaeon]|nr:UTP--glucose-1-phosphate uridylyltransferase [archaeon]